MTVIFMRKQANEDGSVEGIVQQMRTPASVFINKITTNLPKLTTHCIRFGCTGNIPGREAENIQVINSARAIHRVFDKSGFRSLIPGLCPRTWNSILDMRRSGFQLEKQGAIVRPRTHKKGQNSFLVYDYHTLDMITERLKLEYYIQEYVEKQREYRVHVVQGRVVSVFEKVPLNKHDLVWNEADTINVKWSNWPLDVCYLAIQAFEQSKLHFGAVDVITDGVRHYVLEINTCPELTPYFQQTFARAFDWMFDNNIYDTCLGMDAPGQLTWKHLIHPGVSAEAV